jgi:ABC-type Co2+ transport system permease subunit
MGVESNLHPHFRFINLTLFYPQFFPTFQSAIILSLIFLPFEPTDYLRASRICLYSGVVFFAHLPFLLPTVLKKVRTFFFATGQT